MNGVDMGRFIGFYRQREEAELARIKSRILDQLNITWDDLQKEGVAGDAFPPEFELVGPEQEFYVREDVSDLKNNPQIISTEFGEVTFTTDAGRHQLEINFPPIASFPDYIDLLKKVEEISEYDMYCIGERSVVTTFEDWVDNPRYTALRNAFQAESPDYFQEVVHIANAFALHFHFDYDPFTEKEGLRLLNTWNNFGVMLEKAFNEAVGAAPHRNRRYWSRWASPRRFPGFRWFDSRDEFKEEMFSIPQLIRVTDRGNWKKYLQKPAEWNAPHAGTIYYLSRATSERRVELRVFSSMIPEMCVFALRVAMYVGVSVLRGRDTIPRLSEEEWHSIF